MSKKRPRHEDGTCGHEVLRKNKDGIYMPVVLKDSRGHCPGDPMCPYTELGRIQHRVDMQPAMKRAKEMLLRGLPFGEEVVPDEWLYELVCSIRNVEPRAPVEEYTWPYTKDSLGGNAEYIDWKYGK